LFSPVQIPEVLAILEIISDVNPRSYDMFVKVLENEREKRWKDKKRKKREDFYIMDNIVAFYSRITAKLNAEIYTTSELTKKALRELAYFCITNSNVITTFNVIIRTNIVEIIERYITFEGM
jgi:hypothetical protein